MKQKQGGISRRDFGKLSLAAGVSVLSARGALAETNSETLKIGLIGCGGRGTANAINMLNERNENVQLIALADTFEDRLNSCRNRLENHDSEAVAGRTHVDDGHCFVGLDAYQQLLETDVDIVLDCSPPYARPYHVDAIVDAGKHIFAEKPISVDPVGARQVIAAADRAEEQGLTFVVGTQKRHQREYIETIEQIQDGALGDIVMMRAYFCVGIPHARERQDGWSDLEYRIRNWIPNNWTSGANIVEQHVHNIDVINWVMGDEPPQVAFASGGRAWLTEDERYGDIWDSFTVDYEYPNGVHMFSFSRWWPQGTASSVFDQVTGTEGQSNCIDLASGSGIDPSIQEHLDLVNSVRGDGPYLNQGRRMAYSTLTALMGRMAAYTGERITWDDVMNSDLSIVPETLDFDADYPLPPVPVPGQA